MLILGHRPDVATPAAAIVVNIGFRAQDFKPISVTVAPRTGTGVRSRHTDPPRQPLVILTGLGSEVCPLRHNGDCLNCCAVIVTTGLGMRRGTSFVVRRRGCQPSPRTATMSPCHFSRESSQVPFQPAALSAHGAGRRYSRTKAPRRGAEAIGGSMAGGSATGWSERDPWLCAYSHVNSAPRRKICAE